LCGRAEPDGELVGPHCGWCEKIMMDVQVDLARELGIREKTG